MANDYIPCPDARFHAWQDKLVTYVNAHLGDLGLVAGAMGAEIWVKAGEPASRPPPKSAWRACEKESDACCPDRKPQLRVVCGSI